MDTQSHTPIGQLTAKRVHIGFVQISSLWLMERKSRQTPMGQHSATALSIASVWPYSYFALCYSFPSFFFSLLAGSRLGAMMMCKWSSHHFWGVHTMCPIRVCVCVYLRCKNEYQGVKLMICVNRSWRDFAPRMIKGLGGGWSARSGHDEMEGPSRAKKLQSRKQEESSIFYEGPDRCYHFLFLVHYWVFGFAVCTLGLQN